MNTYIYIYIKHILVTNTKAGHPRKKIIQVSNKWDTEQDSSKD